MAEPAVFPLNVKLHLQRNFIKDQFFAPRISQIRVQRKYYSGSCKSIQFLSWNANKLGSHLTSVKVHQSEATFMKCCCLGTLVNADDAITSDWVPIVDQVLLIASIFLTYTAGVIPAGKPLKSACKDDCNDFSLPKHSSHSGSVKENDKEIDMLFAWDAVGVKLLDSFDAMKQGGNIGIRVTEIQNEFTLRPSSLLALAEFPRLRLLWASFQWLRKEVDKISGKSHTGSNEESRMVFTSIIQNSSRPLYMAWLEEELYLKNVRPDKRLFSLMVNQLNGYDSILQCIRKSGKEDLYAQLICALGFGSARMSGYYGHSLFTQHGVAILEDLVIAFADGIASMYLELISVDSSMSNEMNGLGLSLCTLSTRALQRLRNEVALHQWLHQNMESVVSMYEDRFELRTFQSHVIEKSSKREAENYNWWERLSMRRSGPTSPALSFVVIAPIAIHVKRTKELRALIGWQYYFSLFLELADIAMPLVRTIIAKVSDAISFFLVYLIGRSLGLIYSGIRQSLRWK